MFFFAGGIVPREVVREVTDALCPACHRHALVRRRVDHGEGGGTRLVWSVAVRGATSGLG
jgi:hypothetical protein